MSRVLPNKVAVRNKKDQLFNDLLTMVEKKGLQWKPSEVDGGTALNALKSFYDAVWYVDGHHHTFADRNLFQIACQILLATTSQKNQNTRNDQLPPCVQAH